MTKQEAIEFAARVTEEHPEGCSCGSSDCLSRGEVDYATIEAEIVRDQTDWPTATEKRLFCRENKIACI